MTKELSPVQAAAQLFPSPKDVRARGLNSLPVKRFDYVTDEDPRCGCCGRPLPTAAAYVLAFDAHEVLAGPTCARRFGLHDTDNPIPNLTRGAHKFYDTKHHLLQAEMADPSAMGQRTLEGWRQREAAMAYVLLREEKMPALGVTCTSFRATRALYFAMQRGAEITPALLNPVIKTMNSKNVPKRFSFEALQAEYAHLVWGTRALKSEKLPPSKAHALSSMMETLKRTGQVSERQHEYLLDIIATCFPKAPKLKLTPLLARKARPVHPFVPHSASY